MYTEIEREILQQLVSQLVETCGDVSSNFDYGYIFCTHCHDKEKAVNQAQAELSELLQQESGIYVITPVHHENGYVIYFLIQSGCLSECPNLLKVIHLSTSPIQEEAVH